MTEEQIIRLYGKRCAEHCDDCCVCEVWAMHDLIETQAREIERLRGALRNIRALATKRQNVWGPDGCLTDIECFAIAALAGDSHDLKR